jgi:hypothetical protein
LIPEKGFGLAMLTNTNGGHTALNGIKPWALQRYAGRHPPARTGADREA